MLIYAHRVEINMLNLVKLKYAMQLAIKYSQNTLHATIEILIYAVYIMLT